MGWKITDKFLVDPQDSDSVPFDQGGIVRRSTWGKIKDYILGNATLATSDKTVRGAINEINADLSDLTNNLVKQTYTSDSGTINLNTCITRGTYKFSGSVTVSNWISGTLVDCTMMVTENSNRLAQILIAQEGNIYVRGSSWNGTFSVWKQIANDTDSARTTTAKDITGAINELNSNKINKTSIVNNLTATVAGSVLDATQGKVLQDEVNTINNNLAYSASAITINDSVNYFASSLGLTAKKRGNVVTLHINVYTNGTFNTNVSTTMLTIPAGFLPSSDIVDSATFSTGNYDFGANGYLFVGTGGGIILANTSGNSAYKYCHKVVTYVQ